MIFQGQLDDKDRLIRHQQTKLEELERIRSIDVNACAQDAKNCIETANSATQTERVSSVTVFEKFEKVFKNFRI